MHNSDVIAVIGAGTMGRGIAQVAAQAGRAVTLIDPDPGARQGAAESLREVFAMLAAKGRLDEPPEAPLERISFADDLDAAAGAQWIIEAVPESLELKREVFRRVGRLAPDAVLATNTSTLSVTRIAAASERPERVVGMHFFNPVPLMRLVEVVPGLATDDDVTARTLAFAEALGKHPVCAADRPGFIVNRVARPFYGEALRLAGEGVEPATVDRVMRGLGFRMGPFELLDLIGLDVNLAATHSVYQAFFHESRYRPHPLQQAMVDGGRLGRKRGLGFYRYPREDALPSRPRALATPPRATVLGEGPLADALRRRFGHPAEGAEATVLLDARVPLDAKRDPPAGLPLVTLCWGHSASLACARYGREAVGFSLVAPLGDDAVVELLVPESGADASLEAARRFFEAHGLATVTLADSAGGIGFRILALLVNEAVGALAEGLAGADAIDAAMELGMNLPLGPLAWGSALGLPTLLAALEGLRDELGDPRYVPHPKLRRRAALGLTGWHG